MLFVQADRGLSAIVVLIEKSEKLPVVFPVPAGVVDVGEAFIFDFAADLIEGGKTGCWRAGF